MIKLRKNNPPVIKKVLQYGVGQLPFVDRHYFKLGVEIALPNASGELFEGMISVGYLPPKDFIFNHDIFNMMSMSGELQEDLRKKISQKMKETVPHLMDTKYLEVVVTDTLYLKVFTDLCKHDAEEGVEEAKQIMDYAGKLEMNCMSELLHTLCKKQDLELLTYIFKEMVLAETEFSVNRNAKEIGETFRNMQLHFTTNLLHFTNQVARKETAAAAQK